ncbi:hypothetical protein [Wukongibacter sp. M2B1]|uniref:hypothetical protein n=1 Tax=Wukongibacter sp. M2B1 TaxID=3088895 RepID=UPI003D7A383A
MVANGTKLYKPLTFTDSTWRTTIATGNYYGRPGSQLIVEKSGNLSDAAKTAISSPQKIIFVFGDNYGDTNNYMIVNEFFIQN